VQAACALATAVLVLYALDASLAADLTKRFFLYLPDLGIGIAIFAAGILASRVAARRTLIGSVNRGLPAARLLSALARGGIVVLSSAIALDHLGIGRAIVPSALLILLGGVTLASALAVAWAAAMPSAAGSTTGWGAPRNRSRTGSSTGSGGRRLAGASAYRIVIVGGACT